MARLRGQCDREAMDSSTGRAASDAAATFSDDSGPSEFHLRAHDGHGGGAPRRRLQLWLLGRDRADVRVGGRRLELSRRHSEIAAILAARPDGITSEELALELYGDEGQPGAVRVEVCRLRKLLGESIKATPYRLCGHVECDASRVEALLERGLVRQAAELYEGPVLPRSEAPGVVRKRQTLEGWIRHAVMTSDDRVALWAWLRTASGCEDLPAWKRLLLDLDFNDPRRSLAAARVHALREAQVV